METEDGLQFNKKTFEKRGQISDLDNVSKTCINALNKQP